MNWTNSHIALLTLAVLLSCKDRPDPQLNETVLDGKHLISYDSPMLNSGDPGIVIVDFRQAEAYDKAHIPGAVHLYRNDFQDPTLPYAGMRLNRDLTADRLGRAGISDKHTLVVYDDKGSPDASRLWWLLNLYNFDRVYLLDGGMRQWERMGKETSRVVPIAEITAFRFPDLPERPMVIEKEDLLKLITSEFSNFVVLDARSADEFSGNVLKTGAKKAGRIPGSIHIDWAEAIDYDGSHTFKPREELERIYSKLGADREDTIVVYCHSGVRSSHTTFVLTELLDYKYVLNYDGSWIEWSYDDGLPIETDSMAYLKN